MKKIASILISLGLLSMILASFTSSANGRTGANAVAAWIGTFLFATVVFFLPGGLLYFWAEKRNKASLAKKDFSAQKPAIDTSESLNTAGENPETGDGRKA